MSYVLSLILSNCGKHFIMKGILNSISKGNQRKYNTIVMKVLSLVCVIRLRNSTIYYVASVSDSPRARQSRLRDFHAGPVNTFWTSYAQ